MSKSLAVASLVAAWLPIFFAVLAGAQWPAVERNARARRLAEARMNARLLRFNI